jgi:magnesium transporter
LTIAHEAGRAFDNPNLQEGRMSFETTGLDGHEAPPHAPETAGRLMTQRVLRARPEDTVGTLRRRLLAEKPELSDPILAVDTAGHYCGAIRLASLLGAGEHRKAHELADPNWASVTPSADQEHVAELARIKALIAVPVVDEEGHALGLIPAPRLLDVLWREHTEDIHRLAGILQPLHAAAYALDEPPLRRAGRRLPWLLVGLAGTFVATAVMAAYEAMFAGNVKLAFFVPAIVYLADAIGTQTEAVAVRGLSVAHRGFWHLLFGEVAAGFVIGAVLALLAFAGVVAAYADVRLAAAVGAAILAAGTIATTIGLTLPWILSRIGLDPALGSGPVATIIQDVLSILIYVLAVAAILP